MRRRSTALLCLAVWAVLAPSPARAQQIRIDHPMRAEGLWLFPSALDENAWYWVPAQARLATDESGRPRFSFLRYVKNAPSADAGTQGITQAEGGGILHFLVTYDTPRDVVARAERALRRKAGEAAELRGPVVFTEGRYSLVSSIVLDGGKPEDVLLASGNAPVMEGSQIALAFELPAERATLLQRSLEMANPDIALVFEMTLEGLTDAFDADVVVKWDEVKKHSAWGTRADVPLGYIVGSLTLGSGGGAGYLLPGLGGNAGGILDELHRSQAIEVRTRGEDANMSELLDKAVTTLVELLFEPVEAEDAQPGGMGSLTDRLAEFGEDKDEFGAPMLPLVGISAGYRAKEIRRSGVTTISLASRTPQKRVTTIAFGVGDLWKRHGGDASMFRTVNLADPAFEQREVHVGIDGAILPEFDAYINSVTTTLRKRHENGATTVQEIVVDRTTFEREANDFRMLYGWNGDADRDAWLRYEFQTRWSFKGGGVYETGWTATDSNMIDLYAPYRRKVVRVLGDAKALAEQGVRAVVVNVEHDFFDGRRRERLRLRPDQPGETPTVELTLPLDQREYDYTVTWIRGTGERLETHGRDGTGMIFVDELPAAAGGATP